MSRSLAALVLIAGLAVTAAPADGHTLRSGRAKTAAENAVYHWVLARESRLGYGTFSPPLSSKRVTPHRWVFKFAFRFDGDVTTEGTCKVSVRYVNSRSRKLRSSVYAVRVS